MGDRPNLADPECEPTDEQLEGLTARALARVRVEHEQSLQKLRSEIAEARETVLGALAQRKAARTST